MSLKERHNGTDCLYWNLFSLIPLVLALLAIARHSIPWAVLYVLVFSGHFLILQYRFFCTHCPHYCRDTATTRCMFLWAVPKFFKKNPAPYRRTDLVVTCAGLAAVVFFPVYWLARSPFLALAYFLSWGALLLTILRYECGRCIHFNCPANKSSPLLKQEFLDRKAEPRR